MKRYESQGGSFWARHSLSLSILVVALVSLLGFGLDLLLVKEGLPRRAMMIFSNTLTGLIAGWLFYSFACHERSRRELMRQRMRTIAELNHHIRNALQVIKFCGSDQANLGAMQLQLIKESANRIEWALKEVLPKYPWAPSNKLLESSIPESHWQYVPPTLREPGRTMRKHENPH